jgi:Protein tyrosine and serine/threonine kinase
MVSFVHRFREIFSGGALPFPKFASNSAVVLAVGNDERPDRPDSISDHVWEVITSAWVGNPSERPKIHAIVNALEGCVDMPSNDGSHDGSSTQDDPMEDYQLSIKDETADGCDSRGNRDAKSYSKTPSQKVSRVGSRQENDDQPPAQLSRARSSITEQGDATRNASFPERSSKSRSSETSSWARAFVLAGVLSIDVAWRMGWVVLGREPVRRIDLMGYGKIVGWSSRLTVEFLDWDRYFPIFLPSNFLGTEVARHGQEFSNF